MNGFQIGNKRLKVQHKRVHGARSGASFVDDSGTGGDGSSTPVDSDGAPAP